MDKKLSRRRRVVRGSKGIFEYQTVVCAVERLLEFSRFLFEGIFSLSRDFISLQEPRGCSCKKEA